MDTRDLEGGVGEPGEDLAVHHNREVNPFVVVEKPEKVIDTLVLGMHRQHKRKRKDAPLEHH
jgi:hypothetical protein